MSDDSRDRMIPAAPAVQASRALLSAALGGLLCVAPACSSSGDAQPAAAADSGGASDTGAAKDTATSTDSAGASDTEGSPDVADAPAADAFDGSAPDVVDAAAEASSDGGGASDASDAATGDAVVFCPAEAGVITSSTVDASMTLAAFTALCDMRHGTLQIHPHCGGNNSCKGISYDSGTQVFTEHSCKGLNTCTGYSCVDPC
jgi:hypothetical protein